MGGFSIETFDVKKFDDILSRGLSKGLGDRNGQMCINAAICAVLGLPHSDKDQECVSPAIRRYSIAINDAPWSSPQARTAGLRDLGLAQLGSKGAVNDRAFSKRVSEKTILVLNPKLFRQLFPDSQKLLKAAARCETEGTEEAARASVVAAEAVAESAKQAMSAAILDKAKSKARAAEALVWVAYAAARVAEKAAEAIAIAVWAAFAAARAAEAAALTVQVPGAAPGDDYLILSVNLALDTLRELKSPGIYLLGIEN